MESWSVTIKKSWIENDQWFFDCFAYHDKIQYPPYPGHSVLTEWLDDNCPSAKYEVKYYEPPKSFGSYLEICFADKEEALMFRMMFS